MSFWPFSNTYGSSSHLQKFLDSISDISSVTVDQIFADKNLQQELLDELKTISSTKSNILFAQSSSNEAQNKNTAAIGASDTLSLTSSNADSNYGGSLSKTAREQKLLELLIQPHILSGLIDYLVMSVDFFYEAALANSALIEDAASIEYAVSGIGGDGGSAKGEGNIPADGSDLKLLKKTSETEIVHEKLQRCISCAAEILSTDLWVISNRIIEAPSLMGKLWSILSLPNLHESSPSLAYLIQVLGHLMDSNCIALMNFVRRQESLVDTFLAKIDIPVLMDFFLKLIQTDKPNSPSGILNVLVDQQIIPKLLDILRSEDLEGTLDCPSLPDPKLLFKQTAATEFIKALVAVSSNPSLAVDLETNIGPNELIRELASPKILNVMLNDIMLYRVHTKRGSTANKHGIHNCVSILIELIRKNNSDYDSFCGSYTKNDQPHDGPPEINVRTACRWLKDLNQNPPGPRDPIYLGDLLQIFSDGLPDLVEQIKNEELHTPANTLGLTRFKISELVAELLHCSNMILLNSTKVASLVAVRDKIRKSRIENINTALNEPINKIPDGGTLMQSHALFHITDGMDTISLEHTEISENPQELKQSREDTQIDRQHRKSVDNLSLEGLEDEEPSVSNENPFVCEDRNRSIRTNPSVGDYFKIQLVDSQMLTTIVEQLTKYPWHNFFHNVVFDLIQQVLNGKLNSYNSFLIVELFERCKITDIITEAFRVIPIPRPGYMGHLILVSEEVVKFASLYKPSLISPLIVDALSSPSWEWFVSKVLLKTRELYNVVLGTDPDYSQDEDIGMENEHHYGFDSSTVGYVDLENENGQNLYSNHAIILGDSSNHEEFVSEQQVGANLDEFDAEDEAEREDGDEENEIGRRKILDVPIKSMSPIKEFENKDMLYEEFAGHKINFGNDDKYLDDFPGSSSSDEETEDSLYRVPNHQ